MKRDVVEGFAHRREDVIHELIDGSLAATHAGERGLAGGRNSAKNHVAIRNIARCLNAYRCRKSHGRHLTTPEAHYNLHVGLRLFSSGWRARLIARYYQRRSEKLPWAFTRRETGRIQHPTIV
jgi:hypothetical protein